MSLILIILCIITLAYIVRVIIFKRELGVSILLTVLLITSALSGIVIIVNNTSQTNCSEVWSGRITENKHVEEWDEWHKPWTETQETTDSKGKKHTKTIEHPGYWEHHDAYNTITTSDKGTFTVYETKDGKKFDDKFVNSTAELNEFYPVGMPTASIHTYENKVQSSYSIYKHKNIDINNYPNLPDYPMVINNYCIDRFIGEIENKDIVIEMINKWNTDLNNTDNPNNINNIKSYKQINIIFVNLGDVSQDYGIALQDYWKNGNKNDFIISYGTKNNDITWCYPFSWSESENCKYEIKKLMENNSIDILSRIDDSCRILEAKFERKEFADFDYLQIELKTGFKIFIIIIGIIMSFIIVIVDPMDLNDLLR